MTRDHLWQLKTISCSLAIINLYHKRKKYNLWGVLKKILISFPQSKSYRIIYIPNISSDRKYSIMWPQRCLICRNKKQYIKIILIKNMIHNMFYFNVDLLESVIVIQEFHEDWAFIIKKTCTSIININKWGPNFVLLKIQPFLFFRR